MGCTIMGFAPDFWLHAVGVGGAGWARESFLHAYEELRRLWIVTNGLPAMSAGEPLDFSIGGLAAALAVMTAISARGPKPLQVQRTRGAKGSPSTNCSR